MGGVAVIPHIQGIDAAVQVAGEDSGWSVSGGLNEMGGGVLGSVLTHAPVVLLGAEEAVDEDDRRSIVRGFALGGFVQVVGERDAVGEFGG
ncbi:hypothetical protein Tdes44962_MAKER01626 [Teratosphaeria destructans]|uniref:Uncharacterized protein n=1 Tax=Teratosphaeria destructans TaxID=418781 RepID=A0A9W7SYZ6_9PEZI|nr:hypothetical protein Tdes44962_MAKER01626 [Teratosphaeria destructans]